MGIFDKKSSKRKDDDFESPTEHVDLSVPTPAPEPAYEAPATQHQDYGIEQAIALMRTLPSDSVELVVRVVKHTLESTNIDIPTIIEDATAKEDRIDTRVVLLQEEIGDLEDEITRRSREIEDLDNDRKETSMVKERLELAEKLDRQTTTSASTSSPDTSSPDTSNPQETADI